MMNGKISLDSKAGRTVLRLRTGLDKEKIQNPPALSNQWNGWILLNECNSHVWSSTVKRFLECSEIHITLSGEKMGGKNKSNCLQVFALFYLNNFLITILGSYIQMHLQCKSGENTPALQIWVENNLIPPSCSHLILILENERKNWIKLKCWPKLCNPKEIISGHLKKCNFYTYAHNPPKHIQ